MTEERVPVALADCLQHLYRDDVAVAALDVAIVAQLQLCQFGEPCPGEPRTGKGELLAGQGDAVYARAAGGCVLGKATPATADLQYRISFAGGGVIEHAPVFGLLCQLQIAAQVTAEPGARVGHAGIQPCFVEVVAQIVVLADVAGTAAA